MIGLLLQGLLGDSIQVEIRDPIASKVLFDPVYYPDIGKDILASGGHGREYITASQDLRLLLTDPFGARKQHAVEQAFYFCKNTITS